MKVDNELMLGKQPVDRPRLRYFHVARCGKKNLFTARVMMRSKLRKLFFALLLVASFAGTGQAQMQISAPKLSGPRFGVAVITGSNAEKLKNEYDAQPVITQFGWQFETELFRSSTGSVTALSEWVPLVGGLEQGVFLPSLSWLVGLRAQNGAEFGVGPNLSLAGTGLVVAGGITFPIGDLNLPINVAIAPTRGGLRFNFLGGFTIRDRW